MDLKERAARLKTELPAVVLALKDSRTPVTAKLLAAVAIGYALSPVDLVPDFIPVLGYLDDLLILPALIAACVRTVPPEVMADCSQKAEGLWRDGKPKRRYYALPIIALWALAGWLLLRVFWH